jgi:hypothetical protein
MFFYSSEEIVFFLNLTVPDRKSKYHLNRKNERKKKSQELNQQGFIW